MNIIVAGDFCPRYRVADLLERGDFNTVLGNVKDIITKADYSIVNFECPVTKGGEKPISKLGPNLQCSEKGMEAIKWCGFDCVTLANNHFYDFGDEGVNTTLFTCDKYKIDYVGGGHDIREASKIFYKEIEGQTLAIINCCEHEFSIATENSGGSNPLNPIQQFYAIREAKTHADYVLVIVHGGHEHWQLPSPRMVETYRFFIDAGADAVVNHHQHCYSGYEVYNDKPIFYGLGNFCFDNKKTSKIWYEGYMVELIFGKDIDFKIYPYSQCADGLSVLLLPQNTFDKQINKLNNVIIDNNILREATNKYYDTTANRYSNIFEPINNRYYLGCLSRGWLPSFFSRKRRLIAENYICCEAHRDKLFYWFTNKHDNSI